MNLRPPAPKAGALPGCATPRTHRKAYHLFVSVGRGIRQVLVPNIAEPRKSVGSASRRPNSAGHTILKYPEVSSKPRQPHVSKEVGRHTERIDYEPVGSSSDRKDAARPFLQFLGQLLVEREGMIRWTNIECAREGLAGLGRLPTDAELLAAVRALPM